MSGELSLDDKLLEHACRTPMLVAMVRTLLKEGANPWHRNQAGASVLGGIFGNGENAGMLALKAWLEHAAAQPELRPKAAKHPFEVLLQASNGPWRMNRRNTVDYALMLLGAGHDPNSPQPAWQQLFPTAQSLDETWRWDVAHVLVEHSPDLAAIALPDGSAPFSSAMGYMDPGAFVCGAAQWPGADLNLWQHGEIRERELCLRQIEYLLDCGGEGLIEAGLDVVGADRNDLTLGHHLLLQNENGGNPQLPGAALLFLLEHGADFWDARGPGWSVAEGVAWQCWTNETAVHVVLEKQRTLRHQQQLEHQVGGGASSGKPRL